MIFPPVSLLSLCANPAIPTRPWRRLPSSCNGPACTLPSYLFCAPCDRHPGKMADPPPNRSCAGQERKTLQGYERELLVMDGHHSTMSWKAPTVMQNRSRTQDGDARSIRSGLWMPTSHMLKSSNANNAGAWLTLKSASYGERKRSSWILSVRSTEGKQ